MKTRSVSSVSLLITDTEGAHRLLCFWVEETMQSTHE